jgi:hypothetical protein
MLSLKKLSLKKLSALALLLPLVALPALAQNSAPLRLSLGFARQDGVVNGSTGGSYSLSTIAKFDREKNPCLGYASSSVDHVVTLNQGFPKLTFQVNSRGKDTTLVIKTPDGQILCGDDTGSKKDASVSATNLPAGNYEVWVGSMEPSKRWSYSLTMTEK